jgi:spore photoproduct lyase
MNSYDEKFETSIRSTYFAKLPPDQQAFIKTKAYEHKFSFQQLRLIIEMANDFEMWDEQNIIDIWPEHMHSKVILQRITKIYEEVKNRPNSYDGFDPSILRSEQKFKFVTQEKEGFGLGMCPVASEETRCCNLMTLDAVESCGFDCSYCTIQSFYKQDKITFDSSFTHKLKNLKLDPKRTYHIGTGQSSDSLMWGNKEGVLDALFDFARSNENVILEFKTKSDNITYFLENDVPKNVICTWSLNTPVIIENEEHLAASLAKRIASARALADKGVIIGFHFHPIVEYEDYLHDYKAVYDELIATFTPEEVSMVSMGTLTFIKPVIQKLRQRNFKSKILQMPFDDAAGKASYPMEIKEEMFTHAYESFKPWHGKVFFYLCMEDHSLWKKCFGYEYNTNADLERAMVYSYCEKTGTDYIFS